MTPPIEQTLNSKNKWSWAGDSSYTAENQLNQIFVDTVRKTGENNSDRCLIVNTYAASVEQEVINHFILPQDSVENCLIIGVHYFGTTESGISMALERLKNK